MSFPDREDLSKPKDYMGSLPPTTESKGVTESKQKEHELPFHPHFIYEGFKSLYNC